LLIVHAERIRQEKLKRDGRFTYTLADDEMPDTAKLACIIEEIGEVGRNVLAREGFVTDGDGTLVALHKEICQVAALSVAWMENLTLQMDAGRV
jgi:hypothetical protein